MRPISFQSISACLVTAGAIIALWGVLTISPSEVIDSSIIWNDEPGVIRALFSPSGISDYIHQRNKAVLGLILVIVGFLMGFRWFDTFTMGPKTLSLFILVLLIFAVIVAGTTRQKVLTSWKGSKYHWFLNLLDDKEFLQRNEQWKARGQENDNLKDMVTFLGHLNEALGISADIQVTPPTFEKLNLAREVIKEYVSNQSLFYYLWRPKKLLWAFK